MLRLAAASIACGITGLALLLAGCQGTQTTYAYEPLGDVQSMPAADADAICLRRANAEKREAAKDVWAQGGQPAIIGPMQLA